MHGSHIRHGFRHQKPHGNPRAPLMIWRSRERGERLPPHRRCSGRVERHGGRLSQLPYRRETGVQMQRTCKHIIVGPAAACARRLQRGTPRTNRTPLLWIEYAFSIMSTHAIRHSRADRAQIDLGWCFDSVHFANWNAYSFAWRSATCSRTDRPANRRRSERPCHHTRAAM
jgi:hypothetical protein